MIQELERLMGNHNKNSKEESPCKRTRKEGISQKELFEGTEEEKQKRIEGTLNEVEMISWDTAELFSNSRPSPSFFVLDPNRSEGETQPPIFDGSIASATTGISAGAGTVLHLACALDSPFMLAILLVLGADAASFHTAFLRGIIHEAACCGSVNCLALLLEFGRKYGMELGKELAETQSPNWLPGASIAFGATHGLNRLDQRRTIDQDLRYSKTRHPLGSDADDGFNHASNAPPVANETKTTKKTFLETLQLALRLATEVNSGKMSEITAAQNMLGKSTLSLRTMKSMARACFFEDKMEGTSLSWRDCTDGHGNTPLHWASFKNATDCVSLLLDYHANPNIHAQSSGWTPLHDAAYSDAAESIELLLNAGALIDAKANSGATPLCFAAQEDAPNAARLLLERGANAVIRCGGTSEVANANRENATSQSRFSGYTPLHYCAHYNANNAAKVLLAHSSSISALETVDFSERLPIHVAVARGSSDVLREFLRGGARIDTTQQRTRNLISVTVRSISRSPPSESSPPVSSPVLRSMIPIRPVSSSKPWNCLTQRSIDECRLLISEAEGNWSPGRHSLFTPSDRRAVMELLRIGKRLEQQGTGIFIDLWPLVLGFCGRGWFDVSKCAERTLSPTNLLHIDSSEDEFTQFLLD